MARAADPCVCFSCRRDTNADAADAPRWVAPAPSSSQSLVRSYVVTEARKQCRVCRGQWDGLIFGPSPSKGSPLPFGICPPCADANDRAVALAAAPTVPVGMPLLELQRPRRVSE